MDLKINKGIARGAVQAPASKSYTIRALLCAGLAQGSSSVIHPLKSEDTEAACRVLGQIGVTVAERKNHIEVEGGQLHPADSSLHCGDSAATMRFMAAVCSLLPGKSILTAGPSLAKRPVQPLLDALKSWGISSQSEGGYPPVTIEGAVPGDSVIELPGNISSQYVSALLLAAPGSGGTTVIRLTTPLESSPYVLMTLECMQKFGVQVEYSDDLREFTVVPGAYQPGKYVVEGDWSSASYLLALGAACGEVTVMNLKQDSLQGDRILLKFLAEMGASVEQHRDAVTVSKRALRAIKADLQDCIDLLPTMAVLAALADGTSEFSGIERARLKESNRVDAVRDGLEQAGIPVTIRHDKMSVTGSQSGKAVINSYNDHRIAMAFSILAMARGRIVITGAECVSKTYPQYWDVLGALGGKVVDADE